MAYFKIDNNDYSMFVNALKVERNTTYRAQTNAAGDTVVDNQKQKRTLEVGIIPLDNITMKKLQEDVNKFKVNISFLNPATGALEENVLCIIPTNGVEYYTIQSNNVKFKAFTLKFTEL